MNILFIWMTFLESRSSPGTLTMGRIYLIWHHATYAGTKASTHDHRLSCLHTWHGAISNIYAVYTQLSRRYGINLYDISNNEAKFTIKTKVTHYFKQNWSQQLHDGDDNTVLRTYRLLKWDMKWNLTCTYLRSPSIESRSAGSKQAPMY